MELHACGSKATGRFRPSARFWAYNPVLLMPSDSRTAARKKERVKFQKVCPV